MPKTTGEAQPAHNGKRIATVHGFSTPEAQRLEQTLRASAKTIAPTPIGNARNTLYASHKEQIFTQFQGQWDWSKTTQKWVMSSIGKVLSNYLFDYNKKQEGTSKTVSKARTAKKIDSSELKISQPKHIVQYLEEATPPKRSRGRQRKSAGPSSFTPINKLTPPPNDQLIPRLTESPFDKPSKQPIDSVLQSIEHTPVEEDASQTLPKLTDIILVVYPSSSDPWGREMFSFPLWRCQAPVNGRDAPSESLQDWRDLSFMDFVRQLKGEQVLTPDEMIVWGEFEHVVTSDMTFASAVQEQLYDASSSKTAPNEATFAIVGRPKILIK
ncbi:hypothetical protein QM012_007077 [Aureobasidium pullulans]|uniref:Uncharacterized protein n=1 Tax=Aureobasidium pullulans TaxID=5580 RepID=A0ABR0TNG6_AURPU